MLVQAYPVNKTGINYIDKDFSDIKEYNACAEWYTTGDRLEVWYDNERYEEVVYRRFGEVCCLYEKFNIYACNDSDDDKYERQIAGVLKQEALDYGFPERLPHKTPYIAHMQIPISVWFKAKDKDEAERVALKLRDRITVWTRGGRSGEMAHLQREDALVSSIMTELLDTELVELQDDSDDQGVADYTLNDNQVNEILEG